MSAVNELVVREYFEQLGFLVSQPQKYVVPGRPKKLEEEIDLVIIRPSVTEQVLPDHMVWTTEDLQGVGRAIVGVRGGHTGRFYASRFEQSQDIPRFAEPAAQRVAAKLLGTANVARILCLPDLPASGELKQKTINLLKQNGIDGVISFRTILDELVRGAGINRNYEKSDVLQIIRLLKKYDLLRETRQLELFARRRRST